MGLQRETAGRGTLAMYTTVICPVSPHRSYAHARTVDKAEDYRQAGEWCHIGAVSGWRFGLKRPGSMKTGFLVSENSIYRKDLSVLLISR
jgi:hypothetical protein